MTAAVEPVRIPRRADFPTEPGWYVVQERGADRPLLLRWGPVSRFWKHTGGPSRVEATGWVGPLRSHAEELPL